MSIITSKTEIEIDLDEIKRGTLIWAKHRTWEEGISGIVAQASPGKIIVSFLPNIQNVRNHFVLPASELENGEWLVRYSSDDLVTVSSFGTEE